jgi:hypothetical protein
MISLHDDFLIGLVISQRVAVLAWGEASSLIDNPRIRIPVQRKLKEHDKGKNNSVHLLLLLYLHK